MPDCPAIIESFRRCYDLPVHFFSINRHLLAWSCVMEKPLPHYIWPLTAEERDQCGRLLDKDRQRSMIGKGVSRMILALALEQPAQTVLINWDGKPCLIDQQTTNWSFNISHSGQWIAGAVSNHFDVGIDIEEVKYFHFWEEVASQIVAQDDELTSGKSLKTFFDAWTAKESFIKMVGSGLEIPMHEVRLKGLHVEWRHFWGKCCRLSVAPAVSACLCLHPRKRKKAYAKPIAQNGPADPSCIPDKQRFDGASIFHRLPALIGRKTMQ